MNCGRDLKRAIASKSSVECPGHPMKTAVLTPSSARGSRPGRPFEASASTQEQSTISSVPPSCLILAPVSPGISQYAHGSCRVPPFPSVSSTVIATYTHVAIHLWLSSVARYGIFLFLLWIINTGVKCWWHLYVETMINSELLLRPYKYRVTDNQLLFCDEVRRTNTNFQLLEDSFSGCCSVVSSLNPANLW